MSLVTALLLSLATNTTADPLAASAARVEHVLPGVSQHLVAREEASGWFSAAPWGGRLVVPDAVLASATTDAERDALLLVTIAWARPAVRPAYSPLGQFLAEVIAMQVEQSVLNRSLATPNDTPAVSPPRGVARENVRYGPAPAQRALTLATRHGIGVCPMVSALIRLSAPAADGQLSAIALDARRARRELGLAAHGC